MDSPGAETTNYLVLAFFSVLAFIKIISLLTKFFRTEKIKNRLRVVTKPLNLCIALNLIVLGFVLGFLFKLEAQISRIQESSSLASGWAQEAYGAVKDIDIPEGQSCPNIDLSEINNKLDDIGYKTDMIDIHTDYLYDIN